MRMRLLFFILVTARVMEREIDTAWLVDGKNTVTNGRSVRREPGRARLIEAN